MKKIQFLKLLTKNNFRYLLLSDNSIHSLKNQNKDLDLYIDPSQKDEFENFIKKLFFFKRIEKVKNYPQRFFYYNKKNYYKYSLDIMYEISLKKYLILKYIYSKTNDALNSRLKKNNIYFTDKSALKQIRSITKNKNLKKFNKNILNKISIDININFYRRSNYILFIGSDGTGKTTLIKCLQQRLKIKSIVYKFGQSENSWYLKINKIFYNNYLMNKINISKFFLFVDILLRRISMLRYSNNKLVLIDRFPGFAFQKKSWANYLIKFFLPKPDLIILLQANNAIRKKRKPKEIKNDQSKWDNVSKSINCETFKLSTSYLKISLSCNNIIQKIFSKEKFTNKILTKLR
tara:strand:- start:585 stop:1625 length:1041 start_codon:yes stop_codon:yes gene_type:complete